jgi:hypothetical protein
MLLLYGVGSWIGIQTCVNVMMANAFLPAIGIPLPFISSGGSSLVALWLAVGACQASLAPVPDRERQEPGQTAQPTRLKPTPRPLRRAPSSTTFNQLKVTGKPQAGRRK